MIDFWTNRENHSFVIHLKTVLQTTALVLLAVALYSYYHAHEKFMEENIDEIEKMENPFLNIK